MNDATLNTVTTPKGYESHYAVAGATKTVCGREVLAVEPATITNKWGTFPNRATCRNCSHKVEGSRRTRYGR
jgi:hypothetical protein